MADKNIGSLSNLADVQDVALLVVEFGGEAYLSNHNLLKRR